jgi:hypothetical protein
MTPFRFTKTLQETATNFQLKDVQNKTLHVGLFIWNQLI